MIIKFAKKGTHKGKRFWAYTRFLDCDYIVAHGYARATKLVNTKQHYSGDLASIYCVFCN